jgi:hypothetical protein
MPMSASDGPHYEANIKLNGVGDYKVRFIILNPRRLCPLSRRSVVSFQLSVVGDFWPRAVFSVVSCQLSGTSGRNTLPNADGVVRSDISAKTPPPDTRNPAEKRKQKALLRRQRWNCGFTVALLGLAVFVVTALKAWDRREVALSPPEPFTLHDGEIIIPFERIEDGRLHRFAWNASDNTEVRFIVIKKSASGWGVGLDACDICGNTGYYERRDGVICTEPVPKLMRGNLAASLGAELCPKASPYTQKA